MSKFAWHKQMTAVVKRVQVPGKARPGLALSDLVVLSWIFDHTDSDGAGAIAPIERVAADTNLSRSTVEDALKTLRATGMASQTRKGGRSWDGSTFASVYRLGDLSDVVLAAPLVDDSTSSNPGDGVTQTPESTHSNPGDAGANISYITNPTKQNTLTKYMSDDHCVAKEPSQAPVQTDSIRDYLLENTSGLGESEETSSGSNSSFEDDALSKRDEVAFESTVVAPKLSCLKDSGSDKEGKGLSNKPAELSRVSFDAWALLGAADDVFIAAATDLGVNAGVLCGKAQTEFGDGEYRTVVDWSRVVAQFLTTSIGSDDAVQAELPTTVPDMTDVLRSADDDTLLTLDEFYKGWRIGVIAEFLDARDLVAGDATEYWDYQRAMRAELLYSGEVLSERAWFTLFASRVWASDGDRGESDRAEGLSRLRAVQLDMGLIPKHGRRLRELQTATAVALGDVPEESDDSSGQRAGYSM